MEKRVNEKLYVEVENVGRPACKMRINCAEFIHTEQILTTSVQLLPRSINKTSRTVAATASSITGKKNERKQSLNPVNFHCIKTFVTMICKQNKTIL